MAKRSKGPVNAYRLHFEEVNLKAIDSSRRSTSRQRPGRRSPFHHSFGPRGRPASSEFPGRGVSKPELVHARRGTRD